MPMLRGLSSLRYSANRKRNKINRGIGVYFSHKGRAISLERLSYLTGVVRVHHSVVNYLIPTG